MRAVLVHYADASLCISEHDEVLAEYASVDGRAVRFADFLDQRNGRPVMPHQLAHRGIALYPAQQLVLFVGQHVCSPGERS